ncbi:unnamed protein product, partial [Choristocarpus tenellus]
MPKGVSVFKEEGPGLPVAWAMRLLSLRGKGKEALDRVRAASNLEIRSVTSRVCNSEDPEDEDTAGVRVKVTSPLAAEEKDQSIWLTVEEVLAILLAGVKVSQGSVH